MTLVPWDADEEWTETDPLARTSMRTGWHVEVILSGTPIYDICLYMYGAAAPKLDGGLDISRGCDCHWKKKRGIPIGVRIEVEITVGGAATDNVGVKYVYVQVSTIGAYDDVYLRPGSGDDIKRYEFEHTFEFDLSLKKLVGDLFIVMLDLLNIFWGILAILVNEIEAKIVAGATAVSGVAAPVWAAYETSALCACFSVLIYSSNGLYILLKDG